VLLIAAARWKICRPSAPSLLPSLNDRFHYKPPNIPAGNRAAGISNVKRLADQADAKVVMPRSAFKLLQGNELSSS
jgi:hypothetical protein